MLLDGAILLVDSELFEHELIRIGRELYRMEPDLGNDCPMCLAATFHISEFKVQLA